MSARLLKGTDFFESQAEDLALKWGTSKVFETQLKKKKKNLRSWHQAHHFMANRRGESGSSNRLYFLGLQNHCRCLK